MLQGKVSDDNEIAEFLLNGEPVPLEEDGSFKVEVELTRGENAFRFRAEDALGNDGFELLKVVRPKS